MLHPPSRIQRAPISVLFGVCRVVSFSVVITRTEIKLFVIKLINDTLLKYKIITEAFSRLVSIVVSRTEN